MQPVSPIQTVQPMQMAAPALPGQSRYSRPVKSLGTLQIILAVLAAILGITAAVYGYGNLAIMAAGAWGGLAVRINPVPDLPVNAVVLSDAASDLMLKPLWLNVTARSARLFGLYAINRSYCR